MAEPSANAFTGLSWLKTLQEMEIIKISMKTFTHVTQRSADKHRHREIKTQAASSPSRWSSCQTIFETTARKMLHLETALKDWWAAADVSRATLCF